MKLKKSFRNYAPLQYAMHLKGILIFVFFMLCITMGHAQPDSSPDFMRSVGKIYVVAGVTLVILITLFIYLIFLDRKISRIEKRQNNE